MPTRQFKFSFRLSEGEFCRAHRVHLRRTLLNVKTAVFVTIGVAFASLQAQVLGPDAWVNRFFGLLWLTIILLMIYAFFALPKRLYRKKREYAFEHIIETDERGLRVTVGNAVREYRWEDLSRISETPDFILLYFATAEDRSLPFVIPKSSPHGPAQSEEEFRAYLYKMLHSEN